MEWTRRQVWSKRDAARRDRSLAVAIATGGLIAVLLTANYSCYELVFLDDLTRGPRSGVALPIVEQCSRDEDCVVLPAIITCCGECPAAPPFQAESRRELAELRSDCTGEEFFCEPPVCSPAPPGCAATAVCSDGQCRAIPNDRC